MTNITKDTIVYVGSLWHRDCDPFVTVVAQDPEKCQQLLDEAAEEERYEDEAAYERDEAYVQGEDAYNDDIMTGGVFAESLISLKLSAAEARDLAADGYAYLRI